MNPLRLLQRPEYFFRPGQAWRRLRLDSQGARNQARLAWGLPVEIDPDSYIGVDVRHLGLFDRVVVEAICRLLDPGEQAIDVGANIGLNLSIMALAVGPRGRVFAFEPGPSSWSILSRNLDRWSGYDLAPMVAERKALSSRVGVGMLREATDIGGFSLEEDPPETLTGVLLEVELTTLDAYLAASSRIGLMKIDVEGHELAVLEGASQLLLDRRVRDIVFEDYHPQPSPVTLLLRSSGYTVFSLHTTWRRPLLLSAEASPSVTNYMATLDPERTRVRLQPAGWQCLRLRARPKAAAGAKA